MTTQTRILKSANANDMLAAGQFNYEDLKLRCENYLESVRQQSRQMLVDAQKQVEQIHKNAAEQGRQAGLAEGLKQAESQLNQKVSQQAEQLLQQRLQKITPTLQQAAVKLEQERQQCLSRWETQSLELILGICEKLIHQELSANPNILKQRVIEVLQLAIGSPQIIVRIAESDLAQSGPQLEAVIQSVQQQAQVLLTGDPSLKPGDCIVETEHGRVDAQIQTQLNRIATELLVD